jgi:hypothetical protein
MMNTPGNRSSNRAAASNGNTDNTPNKSAIQDHVANSVVSPGQNALAKRRSSAILQKGQFEQQSQQQQS